MKNTIMASLALASSLLTPAAFAGPKPDCCDASKCKTTCCKVACCDTACSKSEKAKVSKVTGMAHAVTMKFASKGKKQANCCPLPCCNGGACSTTACCVSK